MGRSLLDLVRQKRSKKIKILAFFDFWYLSAGPFPHVCDKFADAFVAMVLSHTSLTLLVRLAF